MKIAIIVSLGAALLISNVTAAQDKTAAEAFDHYEAIRAALFADSTKDVAVHANLLAPLAGQVAGAAAKTAAERLALAKTLDDARTHFGELSAALVPKFQTAKILGAHAFLCPMNKRPWMQKGEKVANPYYGKAMADCGSSIDKRE
jgi:hypothetical protein